MVKNIIIGWWRYLFKKPSELAKRRYQICKKCSHMKKGFCELCGCYCKAKTEVEDESCKLNKW